MLFNSWEYVLFFLFVYGVYVLTPRYKIQNVFLLICGYYFYAAWDWRFLSLLFISTVVDFYAGIKIHASMESWRRKGFLFLSIGMQLTLLGFFKYYNFFAENLSALLGSLGIGWLGLRLDIILPVGISFYTFQTMSYTIDIYRKQLTPTRDFIDYALFASFFPQLVAGPIERAKKLLPQIQRSRKITALMLETGCWLVFWGLFKKVVIADNLAIVADKVFTNSSSSTASMAYLGVLAFTFQVYCDFSGYSDVARGCGKFLGFELDRNFNLPFYAESPSDFWRRWHISLSTWLRDYLYIPLGGSRCGTVRSHVNAFATMVIGGLWHGASWNFLWWGAYHGALLSSYRALGFGEAKMSGPPGQSLKSTLRILVMFQLSLVGWLLFRANRKIEMDGWMHDDSFKQIVEFVTSFRNGLGFDHSSLVVLLSIAWLAAPLLLIQHFQYRNDDHYFLLRLRSPMVKTVLFALLGFMWVVWGVQEGESFIYFQF